MKKKVKHFLLYLVGFITFDALTTAAIWRAAYLYNAGAYANFSCWATSAIVCGTTFIRFLIEVSPSGHKEDKECCRHKKVQ